MVFDAHSKRPYCAAGSLFSAKKKKGVHIVVYNKARKELRVYSQQHNVIKKGGILDKHVEYSEIFFCDMKL